MINQRSTLTLEQLIELVSLVLKYQDGTYVAGMLSKILEHCCASYREPIEYIGDGLYKL